MKDNFNPKVCGIIAEYNPFHNGHAWQIEKLRREFGMDIIIAAMSGGFTQRGEPAIADKHSRAMLAAVGGVDLVIELPAVFALRSAQDFARGGADLLQKAGAKFLAFGAENADKNMLTKIAAAIDATTTQEKLRKNIKAGQSYAAALTETLELTADKDVLRQPNNILAVEYLRAVNRLENNLAPIVLPRMGAGHNETKITEGAASGAALRKTLFADEPPWDKIAGAVPSQTLNNLRENRDYPQEERLFRAVAAKIADDSWNGEDIFGLNEGLGDRLKKAAKTAASLAQIIDMASAKRYPKSRIRRALCHIMLNFAADETAEFDKAGAKYIRVLAFNDRGRLWLKKIKSLSPAPIVNRLAKFIRHDADNTARRMIAKDVAAADLQELCRAAPLPRGRDFVASAMYIKRND